MAKQVTFVVKSSKDYWVVQKEGKKAPESRHKKKEAAFKKGRSMAKRAGGILKIKAKTPTNEALKKVYKMSVLNIDEPFRAWVQENYPLK